MGGLGRNWESGQMGSSRAWESGQGGWAWKGLEGPGRVGRWANNNYNNSNNNDNNNNDNNDNKLPIKAGQWSLDQSVGWLVSL